VKLNPDGVSTTAQQAADLDAQRLVVRGADQIIDTPLQEAT
jgi:hypothetical protein